MINLSDENTLSVFTDASIFKADSETYIGAPGFATVYQHRIVNSGVNIMYKSTNNNSEIAAIHMGILELLKYKNSYRTLNLFSDSRISIMGMREWIFKWVNNKNPSTGRLYSSSGTEVANQELFLHTMKLIVTNMLSVNLYHQRGHINFTEKGEVMRAMHDFETSNGFTISYDLAVELCRYNDFVDNYTRDTLKRSIGDLIYEKPEYMVPIYPIKYAPRAQDVQQYEKLVNKGGK